MEARTNFIRKLKQMLEQERTNITTTMVIINHVEAWLTKQPIPNINIIAVKIWVFVLLTV
jgi:hypothetical protein